MKRLIFLLVISLLFNACSNLFEPEGTYYYKAEGEGYVYNSETNEPMPYAKVGVHTQFESRGEWFTKYPVWEYYYTDETGYFRVKFPRRVDGENAVSFSVGALVEGMKSEGETYYCFAEDVKNSKKTIQVGIIYVKPY